MLAILLLIADMDSIALVSAGAEGLNLSADSCFILLVGDESIPYLWIF